MEISDSARNIIINQFQEPINANAERIQTIERILKQYDEQKNFLADLPNTLKKSVLVPVGTKGFLRGNLVHTNEVLHNIGCDYLVKRTAKQAIDACNRRVEEARSHLEKLNEEKSWLEQRLDEQMNKNAFGNDENKEIIETYDEDKEKEWRLRHRESVRAMKVQEAKERAENSTSDRDVFELLDILELEEELNEYENSQSDDNRDTVNENEQKEEIEYERSNSDNNNVQENLESNKIENNSENLQQDTDLQLNKIREELLALRKKTNLLSEADIIKRVDELEREDELLDEMDMLDENSTEVTECSSDSTNGSEKSTTIRFSDDVDWKVYDSNEIVHVEKEQDTGNKTVKNESLKQHSDSDDEDTPVTLHLRFSHSDNKPEESDRYSDKITKPSDFYNRPFRPKSILKNKDKIFEEPQNCRTQNEQQHGVCNRNWVCFDSFSKSGNDSDQENLNVAQVPAITEVKEKTETAVPPVTSAPRKRQSRFSVSRAVLPKK